MQPEQAVEMLGYGEVTGEMKGSPRLGQAGEQGVGVVPRESLGAGRTQDGESRAGPEDKINGT